MRDLAALILEDSMARCLEAIHDLASAEDLTARERALRLEQLTQCALGADCPEVAFDPTARTLRAIDRALLDHPEARARWRGRVTRAASCAGRERVLLTDAA